MIGAAYGIAEASSPTLEPVTVLGPLKDATRRYAVPTASLTGPVRDDLRAVSRGLRLIRPEDEPLRAGSSPGLLLF